MADLQQTQDIGENTKICNKSQKRKLNKMDKEQQSMQQQQQQQQQVQNSAVIDEVTCLDEIQCGQMWNVADIDINMADIFGEDNEQFMMQQTQAVASNVVCITSPGEASTEPVVTDSGETVFESAQQPLLCVLVRRNENLLTPEEKLENPKLDQFGISIRYFHAKTGNQYQWAKMGVFMFYRQFAHLYRYLKRIKIQELKRAVKGEGYSPPSVHFIDNMMCAIAHNVIPYGSEMFLNRTYKNSSYMAQSMRISGPAYTGLFDLLERVMIHMYEKAGIPFYRGNDIRTNA